jgi:hypothetical protein
MRAARRLTCVGLLATLALLATTTGVAAQTPWDSSAQPASYERNAAPPREGKESLEVNDGDARSVTFNRREPLVGDQIEQTLGVEMQLDTIVRQQSEVFNRGKMAMKRHQRRQMTTTDIVDGMTKAVLVRYLEATRESAAGPTAEDLKNAQNIPQPVQGKAYRCRRDEEKLTVVDEAGNIPPMDEFEIVAGNMESLGRTNPIGEYLAGRTVKIGDQLSLPHEVAEKLLGLGDTLGKVSQFTLRLDEVRAINGVECAVFHASIDAASADSTQMRLQVEGPLVIQAPTCRAVQACFAGPIGMSETRGSLTATYQMTGTGRMHVDIASTYRDVAR